MPGKPQIALIVSSIALFLLQASLWAGSSAGAGSPGVDPVIKRTVFSFPKVGDYQVLCGDFHIHTTCSDGQLSPSDRVIERWKEGFDVIAIADHRNCDAYAQALPTADSLGMVLLRGLETGMKGKSWENEHYVVLGVSADYKPQDEHAWNQSPGGDI